jgi:hypothetical protein
VTTRIARGDGAQLILVVGLDDREAPRSPAVEHRAEDDHLTPVDERLPVGRVTAHDLALLVGHVGREGGPRRHEPEHEGRHASKSTGEHP